jgi:hypothetical protein
MFPSFSLFRSAQSQTIQRSVADFIPPLTPCQIDAPEQALGARKFSNTRSASEFKARQQIKTQAITGLHAVDAIRSAIDDVTITNQRRAEWVPSVSKLPKRSSQQKGTRASDLNLAFFRWDGQLPG